VNAAHIYVGGIGLNGAVVFPFELNSMGTYVVDETLLADDLLAHFTYGELYINVHTDAFPDGEVCG
jgi:hypothetical protein